MSLLAHTRTVVFLLAAVTLIAVAGITQTGCDGDNGDTAATEATQPAKTTPKDESPGVDEINLYVEQVRELVHISDQLTADYRDLLERYRNKEVTAEEVIAQAESNASAYADMAAQLAAMLPPEGLADAHALIVSGFGKWQQRYELDARGLREENNALLEQATALDDEAAVEVNDAIDEINRVKG